MKITIKNSELKTILTGLSKVIYKRVTLPILGTVRIERSQDGIITMSSTDLDSTATITLNQLSDPSPMVVCIALKELQTVSKACAKGGNVTIGETSLGYEVAGQTMEVPFEAFDPMEWPESPIVKGEAITIDADLRQNIHNAFDCASDDPTRFTITGACLESSHVIGTNGMVLFSSNSFSIPLKQTLLIPKHKFMAWSEFNKGEWQLIAGEESKFQLSNGRWTYVGMKIDGNFPNWRQVVPSSEAFKSSVTIAGTMLPALLETIKAMPCDDLANNRIGIELLGGNVSLLARSQADSPWNKVPVKCEAKGKDVTIFLNREYLSRALRFDLHKIEMGDSLAPMLFSNQGRQMVVMPVGVS